MLVLFEHEIFECDIDDRNRYRRFGPTLAGRIENDQIERGCAQGDRVRHGKGRHHQKNAPPTAAYDQQGNQKREVIDATKDVDDAQLEPSPQSLDGRVAGLARRRFRQRYGLILAFGEALDGPALKLRADDDAISGWKE